MGTTWRECCVILFWRNSLVSIIFVWNVSIEDIRSGDLSATQYIPFFQSSFDRNCCLKIDFGLYVRDGVVSYLVENDHITAFLIRQYLFEAAQIALFKIITRDKAIPWKTLYTATENVTGGYYLSYIQILWAAVCIFEQFWYKTISLRKYSRFPFDMKELGGDFSRCK